MRLGKKYEKKLIFVFLIPISILFIVSLPMAFAANTTIDSNTPGGIAGAISNSSVNDGDTINLEPGIYNKTNQDFNITINKNVTIRGNGPSQNVIIDAQNISQIFAIADNINVTFINITFMDGNSPTNGGAIYNQYLGTIMTFINCTFVDNKASGYGGAIYNNGSNLNVYESNFTTNSANNGGAIYNNGSNGFIYGSNFTNNNGGIAGAAIFNDGIDLNISSSNFNSNHANEGGAILNNATNMKISTSNFSANTGNGAAIVNDVLGNNLQISSSNFTNNEAPNRGGAILNNGANVNLNNSTFISNKAGDGGVIFNVGSNFIVNSSKFINNNASLSGGAIWSIASNLNIFDSEFTNNNANSIGGAIYNGGDGMFVSGSNFTGNNATTNGGAIANTGSNFRISSSNFTGNNATINGGAIFTNGVINVIVESSKFENNNAVNGSAIYNGGGTNMTISSSNFTNNNAIDDGGAIWNNATNMNVSSSIFDKNNATNGGAIYDIGNNSFAIDSSFINNKATGDGGAIWNNFANFTVMSSNFTNNNGSSGGAIWNNGTSMNVFSSKFINNQATNYGGAIMNTGNMSVSNNTMTDNSANLGQMIYNLGDIGVLNLTYINNSTIIVKKGQNIVLFANLVDDMGNTVTGQNISFYINETLIGTATSIEGLANINYTVTAPIGTVTLNGTYEGIGSYLINILNGQLIINKLNVNSTIITPNNPKVGQNITISGKLTDENGISLNNTEITITIGNQTFNVTTNNVGDWSISFIPTIGGNVPVKVTWGGNDTYNNFTNITSFNVSKILTNITVSAPENVKVGDNVPIESKLIDEYGNPIVGKTINFYINGKKIGSAITDSNGIARLNYTANKSGILNIVAEFTGNNTHYGSTANNMTNVSKIKTSTKIIVDGDKITVILVDEYGNLLKDKQVVLKIGGKVIGRGITDTNGQLVIYYKDAYKYRINAIFASDSKYYGSNDMYIPNPTPNPNPTPTPDPRNNSGNAGMKSTGMPILVLLLLLAGISLLGYRKKE